LNEKVDVKPTLRKRRKSTTEIPRKANSHFSSYQSLIVIIAFYSGTYVSLLTFGPHSAMCCMKTW